MTHPPTVEFSKLGPLDLTRAVRITVEPGRAAGGIADEDVTDIIKVDDDFWLGERRYNVSVLLPSGGRHFVHYGLPADVAIYQHRWLQQALTDWATLEPELPEGHIRSTCQTCGLAIEGDDETGPYVDETGSIACPVTEAQPHENHWHLPVDDEIDDAIAHEDTAP